MASAFFARKRRRRVGVALLSSTASEGSISLRLLERASPETEAREAGSRPGPWRKEAARAHVRGLVVRPHAFRIMVKYTRDSWVALLELLAASDEMVIGVLARAPVRPANGAFLWPAVCRASVVALAHGRTTELEAALVLRHEALVIE